MEIVSYIAPVLIGVSLGLIGGGGSILTIPVLVYLFQIDALLATTYSLFIVGVTSIVGGLSYFKKRLVDFRAVLTFGFPSVVGVYLTRLYVVPAIPDSIITLGQFTLTKELLLLLFFAGLMLLASLKMIKKEQQETSVAVARGDNYPMVIAQGSGVGIVTGLVGAGGGFLIIPALVSLLKLPIKRAIGTSLVIIAINSLAGFTFSLAHLQIDWNFILMLTGLAVVGILVGSRLSNFFDGKKLKPAFGWFVLSMGIYIILKELL